MRDSSALPQSVQQEIGVVGCFYFPEHYNDALELSDDWMKGNSAWPGGWSVSKPTWSNTCGCSSTSAFFVLVGRRGADERLFAKPSESWFASGTKSSPEAEFNP